MPSTLDQPVTLSNVRDYWTAPETVEIVAAYVYAVAQAEAIRAHVETYAPAVFEAHRDTFEIAPRKRSLAARMGVEEIATEEDIHLADLDGPAVQTYYAALDAANKEHQDALPEDYRDLPTGYCPALVARSAVTDAERDVFNQARRFLPFLTHSDGMPRGLYGDTRDGLLELLTNPPRGL